MEVYPNPTTGREVRHLRSENVKFSQLTCVTPDMHENTRHILLPHIQAHQWKPDILIQMIALAILSILLVKAGQGLRILFDVTLRLSNHCRNDKNLFLWNAHPIVALSYLVCPSSCLACHSVLNLVSHNQIRSVISRPKSIHAPCGDVWYHTGKCGLGWKVAKPALTPRELLS